MSRPRLYQSVAGQIAALIEAGNLQPGSHLPNERELAARLGVSRSTIREAEIALEAAGRISIRSGWGVVVCGASPSKVAQVRFEDLQVIEALMLILAEVAALASSQANDEHVQGLDRLLESIATIDKALLVEVEMQFYRTIGLISSNGALMHCLEGLLQQYAACFEASPLSGETIDDTPELLREGLEKILAALRQREPSRAREATLGHFQRQMELRLHLYEQWAVAEVQARNQLDRQRFQAVTALAEPHPSAAA